MKVYYFRTGENDPSDAYYDPDEPTALLPEEWTDACGDRRRLAKEMASYHKGTTAGDWSIRVVMPGRSWYTNAGHYGYLIWVEP